MTTEVRKKTKKKTVVTKKSLPSFMKKRIIYHKISKFWHPQQESASPRWSSRKTRGCYSNLILLRFRLQSRSIQASTIKIRSTLLADLIFMAPATGIEPVTTP